jgi:hypothetical protein
MNEFYTYFFIRQVLQTLIFLSDIDTLVKIFGIMLIDVTGKHKPFFNPTQFSGMGPSSNPDIQDRVVLIDTIGSVFAYFQILILIIENKLFTKSQLFIILGALLLHVCSIMNYLYEVPNGESSLEKVRIFPDLFKPILVVVLFYNYIQKNKK